MFIALGILVLAFMSYAAYKLYTENKRVNSILSKIK